MFPKFRPGDNVIWSGVRPPSSLCKKWQWWVYVNDTLFESGRARSETDARTRVAETIWDIAHDLQSVEHGFDRVVPGWKLRTTRRGHHAELPSVPSKET